MTDMELDQLYQTCNICNHINDFEQLIEGCFMCNYNIHRECLQKAINQGIIGQNGVCKYCNSKYNDQDSNQSINISKLIQTIVHIINTILHISIVITILLYYEKNIPNNISRTTYILGYIILNILNGIYIIINITSIVYICNDVNNDNIKYVKYFGLSTIIQYITYMFLSFSIGLLINNIDYKLSKNIYNMIIIPGSLYLALIILLALVLFVILLGIIRIFYLLVRFFRKRSCYDTFPGLYSSEYTRINQNNDIIIYSK